MPAASIRIGSRESRLAVVQSELVIKQLEEAYPQHSFELITMKTTGDILLNQRLDSVGGKGLFLRELDNALLEGRIDFAVHSLKDIPMELAPGTELCAYTKREDPRDALVLPPHTTFDEEALASRAPVGCSGLRRTIRMQHLFPQWSTKEIRGNVITRLRKLDAGEYGGLILAVAGLKRLGLEERISHIFEPDEVLPAAGQGILAITGRAHDLCLDLSVIDDETSRITALAERAFVRTLDGGCSSPIAAYAQRKGQQQLTLTGLYSTSIGIGAASDSTYESVSTATNAKNNACFVTGSCEGSIEQCEELGNHLAHELRSKYEQQIADRQANDASREG